ncbi:MAG: NAD(P)-binding domain-containing protein, partial [Gemmatimonadetes bacterium]|nr:NAD(P)-binding domain-containing protein [Gemmatimonadota bacterium]
MATTVGIIGAGRAGVSLGLALARADYLVRLHSRRARPVPTPLTLTSGPMPSWLAEVEVIILAVPDDAVRAVATKLAATRLVTETQVVLHLSGALAREALSPLEASGAALGSLHPL